MSEPHMPFSKILTLQGERVYLTTPFRTYETRYARHRAKKGPRRMRTYRYVVTGWGDILKDGEVLGSDRGLTMNQATYDRIKEAIDNERLHSAGRENSEDPQGPRL